MECEIVTINQFKNFSVYDIIAIGPNRPIKFKILINKFNVDWPDIIYTISHLANPLSYPLVEPKGAVSGTRAIPSRSNFLKF